MRRYTFVFALNAAFILALAGCSKDTSGVMESNDRLFQSADPSARTKWDKATAAMKSHDYVNAMLALESMHFQTKLTHDQVIAIDNTLVALSIEMAAAARRGDTNAQQAIEAQRKRRGAAER